MTKCNIKENIKNIVMKLKLASSSSTDKDLADALHVSKDLFASWKNQRKQIPIEYLIDFCDSYNTSLDWILRDKGNEKTRVNTNSITIVYLKDIENINDVEYIVLPISTLSLISQRSSYIDATDYRAIKSFSNEMQVTSPYGSLNIFDFNEKKVVSSPSIFLFKTKAGYFLRNISITPENKYFISSENVNIEDIYIDREQIEIVAKLEGVIHWI